MNLFSQWGGVVINSAGSSVRVSRVATTSVSDVNYPVPVCRQNPSSKILQTLLLKDRSEEYLTR